MRCGLLGRKLGHSYSPHIHKALGSYSYTLIEREPQDLESFLRSGEFEGINVTIPYKKSVIPFCDQLSETARKLGAVNTIIRRSDGKLIGHNTDYFGFSAMVRQSGLKVSGKKVLVLGSGGASATAVAVLDAFGAGTVVISRSGPDNYDNLDRHSDAAIIVNTTPVGMYPNTGISPINLDLFPQLEGVLDVIYNPARTALLLDAEERGLVTMNGLWMLVAQAKESSEWFTGRLINDQAIRNIHDRLQAQMQNIILVGMPGCGKSTVGKLLSTQLEREFVDADKCIEQRAGISIPEIFNNYGESVFRKIESDVLRDLGMRSGLIIATGGGCVTKQENYRPLHQNGTIVWLHRNIEQLPTDGRPLSISQDLQRMYAMRKPLYEQFADIQVNNDNTPEMTADSILSMICEEV